MPTWWYGNVWYPAIAAKFVSQEFICTYKVIVDNTQWQNSCPVTQFCSYKIEKIDLCESEELFKTW